jgi:hypothetical protein
VFNVISDLDNPMNTRLPALLDVGEELTVVFPYDERCFLSEPVTHVGLIDSFGRSHWVPRKHVREAVKQFKRDFMPDGLTWIRPTNPSG